MSNLYQDLCAVRELLADEAHWNQRYFACRRDGRACNSSDPEAFSYCLVGAVTTAAFPQRYEVVRAAIVNAMPFPAQLVEWNDAPERTHAEVIQLLGTAIAAAKEAP